MDVRCSRGTPAARGRCQLWVGHEGPHAVMYSRRGQRVVRTWHNDGPVDDHEAGQENLPWVRGMPLPEWDE